MFSLTYIRGGRLFTVTSPNYTAVALLCLIVPGSRLWEHQGKRPWLLR